MNPLPFHVQLRDFFKREENEIWQSFQDAGLQQSLRDDARLTFLKSSNTENADLQQKLSQVVARQREQLGVQTPVKLALSESIANQLIRSDEAAFVILNAKTLSLFDEAEYEMVVASQLARALFWEKSDSDFHTTEQIIEYLCSQPEVETTIIATRNAWRLNTDLVCDQLVSKRFGTDALVRAITKIETGSESGDVAELLENPRLLESLNETTCPIGADAKCRIRALIQQSDISTHSIFWPDEGLSLTNLNLISQDKARDFTRKIVEHVVSPVWMQTEPSIDHARLFFEDFEPIPNKSLDQIPINLLNTATEQFRDYIVFVMLDFVTSNPGIRESAMAHGLQLADSWGIKEIFVEKAHKELRLRKKQIESIQENASNLIAQVSSESANKKEES